MDEELYVEPEKEKPPLQRRFFRRIPGRAQLERIGPLRDSRKRDENASSRFRPCQHTPPVVASLSGRGLTNPPEIPMTITPLPSPGTNNPSGGRRQSVHHDRARERAETALAQGGLREGTNPYALLPVLHDLCVHTDWTPALVRTLELLMRPIPRTDWYAGRPVNYRPVKDLAEDLGITPRALRYQVGRLLALGALNYEDSSNFARYRAPGDPDTPTRAYGYDLSPCILLFQEAPELLARFRAERQALRGLRAHVNALRRRVRTLLLDPDNRRALGRHASRVESDFAPLAAERPERLVREALEALVARLSGLLERCYDYLKAHFSQPPAPDEQAVDKALNAHDCVNDTFRPERNVLPSFYTNTNCTVPTSGCSRSDQGPNQENPRTPTFAQLVAAMPDNVAHELPRAKLLEPATITPEDLLAACAAVRSRLGISPHAWKESEALIGRRRRATVLIVTASRSAEDWPSDRAVQNAGGFFRALSRLVHQGQADLGASIHGIVAHRVAAARAFPRL